jgi:hypothetical protein
MIVALLYEHRQHTLGQGVSFWKPAAMFIGSCVL